MKTDPEHEYDVQLDRLVNSLHALADEVRREGDARRSRFEGISSTRRPVDRTILASDVHDTVMNWVGRKNSNLTCLMFAAIRAEHPTARSTPAELLDQAITALQDVGPADPHTEAEHAELAEAALRGAGVIR
jgi:hypothetical protein